MSCVSGFPCLGCEIRAAEHEEVDVDHERALGPPGGHRPRPVRQRVAGPVDVATYLRNDPERRESERLRPSHLLARGDAIGVGVQPERQLRPDGVGARDHAVIVAAEQRQIVLGEADEAVRRIAALQQRRPDSEELGAIVDQAVAVAVERQEGFVAARTHPLHGFAKAVGVDVERYAAACRPELDAVATRVDDDRAALPPRARGRDEQKNADESFHEKSLPEECIRKWRTWACSTRACRTCRCWWRRRCRSSARPQV